MAAVGYLSSFRAVNKVALCRKLGETQSIKSFCFGNIKNTTFKKAASFSNVFDCDGAEHAQNEEKCVIAVEFLHSANPGELCHKDMLPKYQHYYCFLLILSGMSPRWDIQYKWPIFRCACPGLSSAWRSTTGGSGVVLWRGDVGMGGDVHLCDSSCLSECVHWCWILARGRDRMNESTIISMELMTWWSLSLVDKRRETLNLPSALWNVLFWSTLHFRWFKDEVCRESTWLTLNWDSVCGHK